VVHPAWCWAAGPLGLLIKHLLFKNVFPRLSCEGGWVKCGPLVDHGSGFALAVGTVEVLGPGGLGSWGSSQSLSGGRVTITESARHFLRGPFAASIRPVQPLRAGWSNPGVGYVAKWLKTRLIAIGGVVR